MASLEESGEISAQMGAPLTIKAVVEMNPFEPFDLAAFVFMRKMRHCSIFFGVGLVDKIG